ncbi:LysR family transcriptional regulator [Bradyrhizobium sp. SSBR45G]|uniref:LysR family transcriptional regulator n=1 Tax=unclassified Bradyrhizobium TaxID=2631580 RepID=UPI002342AA26|nr:MULTISPECIES: LysR family transcriptional regulator [unclassified Bradyrhizobium]GLH78722.1 LysR family transcriptional regulator [Bradyrhizobium sp. SSBR45G]GLH87450.1 LysR family transcriptional regulator [Bradyrhizobium sp. SSBR45R]
MQIDWTDLHHFLMLAREGTLSAAARALGVDHVTVARRVAALERATRLKLVDRRARTYALTEDGRHLAAAASPMEQAAFAIERAVVASRPGLAGEVSISAPPTLANRMIAPRLVELHRQHPAITIKLIGEKRIASLNRREADIALRLSRPDEPGLIARKVGRFGFSLYGAPRYLKETPQHSFGFIAYDASMDSAPQQQWLKGVAGPRAIVFQTGDLESQAAAARAGLGIAALPHFLGDDDPGLVRLDQGHEGVNRDIWLVVHRDLRRTPLIRAVMDFLIRCTRPN